MHLSAPIFQLKRRAKQLARRDAIPLHEALDRTARAEGFERWSLLAAHHDVGPVARRVLDGLEPGDLMVLAARREHGKTMLAFELMATAAADGRQVMFFTLEETPLEVDRRIDAAGIDPASAVDFDTSEDISAGYIAARCSDAAPGALVCVDYLQLLDQRRDKPELDVQVAALRRFADKTETIVVVLAQIDRTFDPTNKPLPDLADLRLPNPVDIGHFTASCFMHDGEVEMTRLG